MRNREVLMVKIVDRKSSGTKTCYLLDTALEAATRDENIQQQNGATNNVKPTSVLE
jgi:hypothetical protein